MREDKKLKRFLVLQSFCPLFILIFIKRLERVMLVIKFFRYLSGGDWSVIRKATSNPALGDVIIMFLCIVWFLLTAVVAVGFGDFQSSNYVSQGETITIEHENKNSSVTFFVTFILPLLIDDVSNIWKFIYFIVLLIIEIFLLIQSDLFYQNPVLVALRYKTFEFKFNQTCAHIDINKTYIGISKKGIPSEKSAIKRKYIADDVFFVFND